MTALSPRWCRRSFATTRNAAAYAALIGYSLPTLNRACQTVTGRRLGFTEPTNFGKFFTRETGLPPGTFRAHQHP